MIKAGESKIQVVGKYSTTTTIPKVILENAGIKKGDYVEWYIDRQNKIIVKKKEA